MRREEVDGAIVFVSTQVSDEDRIRVIEGLAAAREFIRVEFGPVQRSICLEIRADERHAGAALTIHNRVIVYSIPGGWDRPYPWLLSRATAHEYIHVWSAEVANDFAAPNSIAYGPGWLVEGIAEYLSMKAILQAGLAPADEAEAFTNTLLRLSMARLEELAGLPLPNAEDYATAELAVTRLMASLPLSVLEQYYTALGQLVLWPTAFSRAFATTPLQFYAEFAATPSP